MFKKVSAVAEDGIANVREMSPRAARFIVLFFLVAGILVSACAIRADWIVHQSKAWPRAEGRVVSVECVNHDRQPTYTYEYIVNGKTQTSTNIAVGWDESYYSFSVGERVVVRYSPDVNPYSFLMKPDIKGGILIHVIGFGWLAIGGISFFALVRGPLARTKPSDFQPRIDVHP